MNKKLYTIFLLPLALTACSLASDITPPPDYQPPVAAQPTSIQVVYPLVPPDPSQGAAIFPEKCAPCHGDTGLGNGPQSSKLPNPVAAIGTAEVARLAKPETWFDVVSNGRMDQSMPPFKSLTDRQRWDVVAYAFSLSMPPQVVQQGKTVYEQKCLSCHGTQGRGDGPQAATAGGKEPDWGDPSRLAQRSANDLFTVISNGVPPAMPAYASQLSEDERWAAAAYIRTFEFASNGSGNAIASAATPAATSAAATAPTADQNTTPIAGTSLAQASTPDTSATALPQGPTSTAGPLPVGTTAAGTPVVTGQVNINGKVTYSAGGSMPSGLTVTLQGFDNMNVVSTATAPLNADGSFAFPSVDVVQNRVWMAQVEYNKVTFSSQPLHSTDIQPGKDASMAITISASSSDATVLKAQRLHVFFDFSTAGTLQVAELFIIQNPTDKAVVPVDASNPALKFELPQGAINLQFQDGTLGDGRYVKTDKGFGDTQTIPPQGTAQELFAYDIPYNNNAADLSVPITMPVDSAVVMVPAGGVNVTGPQVTNAGTRDVQGSGTISMFTAANLASGTQLALNVSGAPAAQPAAGSPAAAAATTNSPVALVIGLVVFGVVLIGGGFFLFRQRRANRVDDEELDEEPLPDETAESILDAIVALDDLYQAGDLPEEAYKERRAVLKDRLKALRS